jgi:NTP pyrophosphatase (non-canonical NTP hydrolase)
MDSQELNKVFDTLVSNCPKLKEVCETWGDQHMLTIAMEENAELIQAISKVKRNGFDPINASHLDEETADVLICICELFVMDYLEVREITRIIERKIERSMQRTQDYVKKLEEEARCDGSF